ncbi:WXG100 family type VII secretion target [Nocardia sp. NPDC058519]|jgi:WXG100 family type VII secretion target|uniref:WXG100 family type VII secretion target n=1 Tax=Nocardia sp. NPDC058519 TaxID=3346535 RepID=UPI0036510DC0
MTADDGGSELWVVPTEVSDAGKFVQTVSETLVTGLHSLDTDVERALESWQGGRADSYREGWDETKRGAMKVLASLAKMAEMLGVTSATYVATDTDNAQQTSSLDLP